MRNGFLDLRSALLLFHLALDGGGFDLLPGGLQTGLGRPVLQPGVDVGNSRSGKHHAQADHDGKAAPRIGETTLGRIGHGNPQAADGGLNNAHRIRCGLFGGRRLVRDDRPGAGGRTKDLGPRLARHGVCRSANNRGGFHHRRPGAHRGVSDFPFR
ncbi:hypothetical protein GAY28_02850 [Azospirillum brasilense]|nr:hypothetical protein [Azospirillum brasilense]